MIRRNLASSTQTNRCKTTNCHEIITRAFLHFKQFACFYLEFSLANNDVRDVLSSCCVYFSLALVCIWFIEEMAKGYQANHWRVAKKMQSCITFETQYKKTYLKLSLETTPLLLTSTSGVIVTGLLRGTTSPSRDFMAIMVLHPSSNTTLCIPAKSFFRCDWITSGLVAWPRISSKSSSPMK